MKKVAIRIVIAIICTIIFVVIVALGRGYRINIAKKTLDATGILAVSSEPDGAKIYIDDVLKDATNSNIILSPGNYRLEIKKEGYSPWSKPVSIKGELVLKIHAQLYPLSPSLSPLTSLGVFKAFTSPTSQKVIVITQQDDAKRDGIYQLEISKHPLSITNPLKLLTLSTAFPPGLDLTKITVVFSPDEKELLLSLPKVESQTLSHYLLNTDSGSVLPLGDTTKLIITKWQEEQQTIHSQILGTYKKKLRDFIYENAKVISFSPDEKRILYMATHNTDLPLIITPRLIATNQTPETRNITVDSLYIYDKEEDRNYMVASRNTLKEKKLTSSSFLWLPYANHLIINEHDHFSAVDYDGTNKRTVYSGPYEEDFFAVSDTGKLIILTNLNPQNNTNPDLYAVGIR